MSVLLALAFGISCNRSMTSGKDVASQTTDSSSKSAEAVIRQLYDFEEKENYAAIYELLSPDSKKNLAQKHKIQNGSDYQEFRYSSEATWSNFSTHKVINESPAKTVFVGQAKVEETGESSIVQFRCTLIKVNGVWKIDKFAY
jgi:hypothetical protein